MLYESRSGLVCLWSACVLTIPAVLVFADVGLDEGDSVTETPGGVVEVGSGVGPFPCGFQRDRERARNGLFVFEGVVGGACRLV